ncbi:MAG: ABC transporter ATP-binding protein [Lachnospiraceae bacterium]
MITGKDICKSFDGFIALNKANIHVPKGVVYGLVGPNGAGKTTLIRHIVGILKADVGTLTLDGEDIFENPKTKAKMAYIPDDIFYFRQSDIKELKALYKGLYPNFSEEFYQEIFPCFPELKENMPIRRMSKGMQKQVAFLLAMACKPEVLILDEPVDGLDPVMRRQIWKIILEAVSKEKLTVLISSHNLRELEDVCDYVGVMHHGQIILEHSLSALQENIHKVQTAFSTEELPTIPENFTVLNHSNSGRVHTWIMRGNKEELLTYFNSQNPFFIDLLPLSLEEIFIYELGGEHYEVKELLF